MRDIEQKLGNRVSNLADEPLKEEILILGIGNFLMGDEGVGVHFIHHLVNEDIQFENAAILDGGVGGFSLMNYFDSYKRIIIIDATMDGKEPGTITLITPKFASDFPKALSAHDFGLKDMIESMYLLGKVPDIYLFTISITTIKPMEISLSNSVKASIPELIHRVHDLIEQIIA